MHHYALRFRLLGVTDASGVSRKTKVSFENNYVRIRIGDPRRSVTGGNTYKIRYRIYRAILFEDDHSVLRWNATGNEWGVPIEAATVTVKLPKPLAQTEVGYDAWTGRYGARQKDFDRARVDDQRVQFTSGPLRPGEGISVEITMPADAVRPAGAVLRLSWWLADNFVYGLVILTLVVCYGVWYLLGRDVPGRGSIVVHYEPPEGLGPSEVGTLIDERVDRRDISATIIDFAVRGMLEIHEIGDGGISSADTDYEFVMKKKPKDLKRYENRLFEKLFSSGKRVRLSDLKHEFYSVFPNVKEDLYRSLTKQRYFDGRPDGVRTWFLWGGLAVLAVAVAVAGLLQRLIVGRVFLVPTVISAVLSAAVVVWTSRVMPRKTKKGRIAWEKIAGLEEYIRRAEAEEIAAKERLGIFERLLPYAIALGVADRWASAFEGIYEQPPQWYRMAGDRLSFTTCYFVSSINRSVHSMNTSLPAAPRSSGSSSGGGMLSGWSGGGFSGGFSGGGFSGGGFGGGGGGSW